MKFLVIPLLFFSSYCFSQHFELTELSNDQRKQLKLKKATYFNNGTAIGYSLYNHNGQLIERLDSSSYYYRWIITYDTANSEKSSTKYDIDGKVLYGTKTKYNSDNKSVTSINYSIENQILNYDSTFYNENGEKIKLTKYNTTGDIEYGFYYSYDSLENLIEQIEYDKFDSVKHRTIFIYDSMGNEIKTVDISIDDKVEETWLMTYDKSGNELTAYCKGECTLGRGWETIYDKEGRETKYIELNENGTIDIEIKYQYNEFGNIIEKLINDMEREVKVLSVQKFDRNNLLIERKSDNLNVYTVKYEFFK